jgi:hypothetical protein
MSELENFTPKVDFGSYDTLDENGIEENVLAEESASSDFAEDILLAMNDTDDNLYTLAQEVDEDEGFFKMKKHADKYAEVA